MAKLQVKNLSQLDGSQTDKSAHEDHVQAYRTLEVTYPFQTTFHDDDGNPIRIEKYTGQKKLEFKIATVADVNSNLSGKYFLLNDAIDTREYYVYYVVDGAGVDPLVPNKTGVAVNIQENETPGIVALATKMALENVGVLYNITRENALLTFTSRIAGITQLPSDFNTTFLINIEEEGTNKWMESILITYEEDANGCVLLKDRKVINRGLLEKEICC